MDTNQVKEPHSLEADQYFAMLPEWILDSDVSAQSIRLYALLNRYANAQGTCFPTQDTLAKRMRVSPDTVLRATKELMAIGALTVTYRRKENGEPTSNLYTLRMTQFRKKTVATEVDRKDAEQVDRAGATQLDRTSATHVPAPVRYKSESLNQSHVNESHPPLSTIAKEIALENWSPFKASSGESQRTVINRILQSLENGADKQQLAKAINYLASNGQPILPGSITTFLGRANGATIAKGSMVADREVDWDSQSEVM